MQKTQKYIHRGMNTKHTHKNKKGAEVNSIGISHVE